MHLDFKHLPRFGTVECGIRPRHSSPPNPSTDRDTHSAKQKIIIVLLFALGIFVTVVDVVRIYYLQLAANESQAQQAQSTERSLDHSTASIALLWSAIEVNVCIICACIPMMKPLIESLLPRLRFRIRELPSLSNRHTVEDDNWQWQPRMVRETAVTNATFPTASQLQSQDTLNQDLSITTAPTHSRQYTSRRSIARQSLSLHR
jgi:hypothetical protein